jgi:hypothetical protein
MQIIPFKEPSRWQEQIELSGEIFVLEFTWNALNEFWGMTIYNRDKVPLIYGITIVPNFPLLAPFTVFGKPVGEIVCQNIVGGSDIIGRFDMSQKFELVYYEEGELEAIAIEAEALNAV